MPRKTLKQRRERDAAREQEDFGFDDTPSNRIEAIKDELETTNDPEDLMLMIMDALKDTVSPIPEVGKFYTFVYNAKTPRIQYDQHPLVACTDLQQWGFKGLNFHWGTMRNYTWEEVVGALHVVNNDEIEYLRSLSYAKYRTK